MLCEGAFATNTGKTANGLVRYSKRYKILGVLDSEKSGMDAGEVLDSKPNGIPVFRNLQDALSHLPEKPSYLILGVATFGGYIPEDFKPIIKEAILNGMGVVAGLHEYLTEDEEFVRLARQRGVELVDVRKPRPIREMRQFSDLSRKLHCLRIPVLGTDGSIGKRTLALFLTEGLKASGVKATFVATGQTALLQGAQYGVPLDAVRGDFMVGELEGEIVRAYEGEHPEVILIEGQGSISHPAYVCGTRAIIMASAPSGMILVHAPARKTRNFRRDVVNWPMPRLEDEIRWLELFSNSKVFALGINHEQLTRKEVDAVAQDWERRFGLPAADPLWHGVDKFVRAVRQLLPPNRG